MKMDAMPLLNHEVGGVTVTLEDDMTKLDPAMKKGATLTLTDRQANCSCSPGMSWMTIAIRSVCAASRSF